MPLPLGTVRVGRSVDAEVVLDTPLASRQHAVLVVGAHQVEVHDAGSVNGVYVNGRRILGQEDVRAGDDVRFGDAAFVLVRRAEHPRGGPDPRRRERLSTDGIDTLVQIIDRNTRRESPRPRPSRPPSVPLPAVNSERPPPRPSLTPAPTGPRSDPFEHQRHLEGAVEAEACLARGDAAGAERALLPALARVRGQVVDGAPIAADLARAAALYAARLGVATGKEGWVNFPVRLYGRLRLPPPDEVLELLETLSKSPVFLREDVSIWVRNVETGATPLDAGDDARLARLRRLGS